MNKEEICIYNKQYTLRKWTISLDFASRKIPLSLNTHTHTYTHTHAYTHIHAHIHTL